jgi:abequosyltransferase
MKLSICIATFKRAEFIAATLDSIVPQLTAEVELVVVDGASPDDTPNIVSSYVAANPGIRYYRENANSGVDGDYDKAVGYAAGEFVWLMTDDDVLKPRAVAQVLQRLGEVRDLLFVNAEIWNADFTRLLKPRFLESAADTTYGAGEQDEAFAAVAFYSSFIGGVVIRRSQWLARERRSYYGTLFVHVGVIFQHPALSKIAVIAEPLIRIRYGNAMWTARGFEIWLFKWPQLVWSFEDFSEPARAGVSPREPWQLIRKLVLFRALGGYSIIEYRRLLSSGLSPLRRSLAWVVAITPAGVVNLLASVLCLLFHRNRMVVYDLARSRHAVGGSRLVARILNV